MSETTTSAYSFRTTTDLDFDAAVARVTAALKEEGFGVLTSIDVQATFKKKLDIDYRKYVILGACNPHLAHRALSMEEEIGLALPCNVVVYEPQEGDGVVISIVDPIAMMGITTNPALSTVAHEARTRLERVAAAVQASSASG
jgi:uncharacterized protein (DUF302 family)